MTETEQSRADLLALAYPYAMDAVSEIERRHIENRVAKADSATVTEFTTAVRGGREMLAALSEIDAVAPPQALESKILQATHGSGDGSRPARPSLLARLIAVLIAGMGMLAVLIAGRITEYRTEAVTAEQVLVQSDSRSRVLELPVGGTVTVNTSGRLGVVAVTFDAVPAPPPGQAYQLWMVSAEGTVRSAGLLTAVPQAGVSARFDPADIFSVTIEPEGGSPRPTSVSLAMLALG
ncbi:anti-sigma factor domain-containing protein [Nocardia sp. 004]|uniref:anti-sigma factor n=1 Tax=Nocardia sp. 004 TaxID=3385978 RepID=UPI0039A13701